MKRLIFLVAVLVAGQQSVAQTGTEKWYVTGMKQAEEVCILYDSRLYIEQWDTLAHPKFWTEVMKLSPDSALVNVAKNRYVAGRISMEQWDKYTPAQKDVFKNDVRKRLNLPESEKILITSGKNHFYKFENILDKIGPAVEIFESECTDPWYAQAILLIESPASHQKSPVGAYGHFQLMPDVARQVGLTVNKSRDDRIDFSKSAGGAARLLRDVCIPETNKMLASRGISYNGTELWYRLLVLHVYHAGAYNVQKALNVVNPTVGSMDIILQLWQTEAGGFRNASQNYSQIALASIIQLHNLINAKCDNIISIVPLSGN